MCTSLKASHDCLWSMCCVDAEKLSNMLFELISARHPVMHESELQARAS